MFVTKWTSQREESDQLMRLRSRDAIQGNVHYYDYYGSVTISNESLDVCSLAYPVYICVP